MPYSRLQSGVGRGLRGWAVSQYPGGAVDAFEVVGAGVFEVSSSAD
jgi:hypothetical protein